MIRFNSDYTEGCHPAILAALTRTNMEQTDGYGIDPHCENARRLILERLNRPGSDVQFLVGGTQTNATVICASLKPYQGVICAATGHINVHETGAIEALGHKVLGLPQENGKITPEQARELCRAHYADSSHEHIVQPGMIYLSQPTETGTLYTLGELEAFRAMCDEYGLILYVDGARLGYGMAAEGNDVFLPELARLCDAFYIGGTKVGALFGEAVVLVNPALQKDFRYYIKRQGGMLAKGRLLGVQFETLFTDGLYEKISAHAVHSAMRIRAALQQKGIPFLMESRTNQQFPILTDAQRDALSRDFALSDWGDTPDGRHATRVCTSWATTEEAEQKLIRAIEALD